MTFAPPPLGRLEAVRPRRAREVARCPARSFAASPQPEASGPGDGRGGRPRGRRRGRGRGDGDEDRDWRRIGVAPFAVLARMGIDVPAAAANEGKPVVVATTTILHDLAKIIAGDFMDIQGLIKPGDDPHVYEPIPMDTVTIENADIILFNGYDLESNLMPLILSGSGSHRKYAVGESVDALPSNETQETSVPDPHVWNDARNAILMVDAIAEAFAECDSVRADVYRRRARDMKNGLRALDKWIRSSIRSIPEQERLLVTTHDAFQYYAKAYGLTIPGTLFGINTEEQPSGRTVRLLVEEIRRVKPRAVFFERTVSPLLIKAVAESAEVLLCEESLYSDSIGPKGSGAETYAEMMVYNTKVIVQALGGKLGAPPPLAMVGGK